MSFRKTGAHLVVEALEQEKVEFVFGIPGTHNIELYDALLDSKSVKTVLITDEQSSGFLADGAFRASGKLSAVNLVPGAGMTHALSGIAEASLDQAAMLVLLCGIRSDSPYAYQLHDVDQAAVIRPLVKKVLQPKSHAEIKAAIQEACQLALTAPYGPVAVEVAANLYLLEAHESGAETKSAAASRTTTNTQVLAQAELDSTIELLNSSKRTLLYLGQGALPAHSRLVELANQLASPVFTSISGKGVFPENHPLSAWSMIGNAAPSQYREIESECDTWLVIGARFAEVATGSYGCKPAAQLIHCDIDSTALGRNYAAQIKIQCDSLEFVSQLLNSGRLKNRSQEIQELQTKLKAARIAVRTEQNSKHVKAGDKKVSPGVLFKTSQEVFGTKAVFVTDSGNGLFMANEYLELQNPRSFLGPVDYSCMGYSVPAGIGATLACPDKPVIILPGDGAFLMTGLELLTPATLGKSTLVLLLRDQELSQIAQFQRSALVRETCTQVGTYNAAQLAQSLGLEAWVLDQDADVLSSLQRARTLLEKGTSVLIDVRIDYSHPTYFSKGVVKTNFHRLPFKDRMKMVGRVLGRKLF